MSARQKQAGWREIHLTPDQGKLADQWFLGKYEDLTAAYKIVVFRTRMRWHPEADDHVRRTLREISAHVDENPGETRAENDERMTATRLLAKGMRAMRPGAAAPRDVTLDTQKGS
jgi:hypothetical protein